VKRESIFVEYRRWGVVALGKTTCGGGKLDTWNTAVETKGFPHKRAKRAVFEEEGGRMKKKSQGMWAHRPASGARIQDITKGGDRRGSKKPEEKDNIPVFRITKPSSIHRSSE